MRERDGKPPILKFLAPVIPLVVVGAAIAGIAYKSFQLKQKGQDFCEGVVPYTRLDPVMARAQEFGPDSILVFDPSGTPVRSFGNGVPIPSSAVDVGISRGSLFVSFRSALSFYSSSCSVEFQNGRVLRVRAGE